MKARDFCYWLQGYFELAGDDAISIEATKAIKNHLNMVFVHEIDPSFPEEQQDQLNKIHENKTTKDEVIMRC